MSFFSLMRIREVGLLGYLDNNYFYRLKEISEAQPNYITFHEIKPLLCIFLLGFIVSFFLLLVENFYYKYHQPLKQICYNNSHS